ncbi:MAG: hypothetical protein EXR86_02460 [Gammaproteobacteria bacterium]|nr:hypothetical protein [Gammaproteobacteria bacterium]
MKFDDVVVSLGDKHEIRLDYFSHITLPEDDIYRRIQDFPEPVGLDECHARDDGVGFALLSPTLCYARWLIRQIFLEPYCTGRLAATLWCIQTIRRDATRHGRGVTLREASVFFTGA